MRLSHRFADVCVLRCERIRCFVVRYSDVGIYVVKVDFAIAVENGLSDFVSRV